MKVEIFHRLRLRGWRFFFRIRARNGRIVAQGDPSGYHNRADCLQTVNALKAGLPYAAIVEIK